MATKKERAIIEMLEDIARWPREGDCLTHGYRCDCLKDSCVVSNGPDGCCDDAEGFDNYILSARVLLSGR